jgi:hypothetical protein
MSALVTHRLMKWREGHIHALPPFHGSVNNKCTHYGFLVMIS